MHSCACASTLLAVKGRMMGGVQNTTLSQDLEHVWLLYTIVFIVYNSQTCYRSLLNIVCKVDWAYVDLMMSISVSDKSWHTSRLVETSRKVNCPRYVTKITAAAPPTTSKTLMAFAWYNVDTMLSHSRPAPQSSYTFSQVDWRVYTWVPAKVSGSWIFC